MNSPVHDPTSKRTEGPTPMGGAWSIAEFMDDEDLPARRSIATRVRITEYALDGSVLHTTVGRIGS